MLLADLALIVLVWIDAGVAGGSRGPRAAARVAVGHTGEVTYRWTNPSGRRVRLRVPEVRPEILGGPQPPRACESSRAPCARRCRLCRCGVDAMGVNRRSRLRLDSMGPLGLGRRRVRVPCPGKSSSYPPLCVGCGCARSVADAMRRRTRG